MKRIRAFFADPIWPLHLSALLMACTLWVVGGVIACLVLFGLAYFAVECFNQNYAAHPRGTVIVVSLLVWGGLLLGLRTWGNMVNNRLLFVKRRLDGAPAERDDWFYEQDDK